jgi:hypothetical protein
MSTIPIPQDAIIAPSSQSPAVSVAIPQDAIVEQQPGKGVTTDSMDADYQFKHPALTDQENQQLKAANLSRPIYRKLLGLPANDPAADALEAKDQAHQTESAQHSSYVQDQLKEKAAGGAIVASSPAVVAATVPAVGATASTIATLGPPAARVAGMGMEVLKSPLGKYVLAPMVGGGTVHLGWKLAGKWLEGLFE